MEYLAGMLVGRPFTILLVAGVFLVAHLAVGARRKKRGARPVKAIAVAALAWGVYGIWEWLVLTLSPEANIRVDLLVIWPLLALISGIGLYRMIR